MARLSSLPGALIEASENLCDLSLRGRYRKSHRQRRDEHNGTGYHWAAHKAFIHRGGACALPELFQLGNKKPVFPPCFQAGVTHIRVTQAVLRWHATATPVHCTSASRELCAVSKPNTAPALEEQTASSITLGLIKHPGGLFLNPDYR